MKIPSVDDTCLIRKLDRLCDRVIECWVVGMKEVSRGGRKCA